MSKGKRTCEVLKDVRRCVARENGIPLREHKCTFEGECRGTCPYCEAEVRYLERELQRRLSLGKAVTVAGIAVSSIMMGGCHNPRQNAPEEYPASPATEEAPAPQEAEESEIPAPGQSDTYEMTDIVNEPDKTETPAPKCASKSAGNDTDDILFGVVDVIDVDDIDVDDVDETEGIIVDPDFFADTPKYEWYPHVVGTPAQYLKERLTAVPASLRNPSAYIVLIIDDNGEVKEVVFQPRNESPTAEEKAFYEDATRILKAMPKWTGGHTAASYEIRMLDLWE